MKRLAVVTVLFLALFSPVCHAGLIVNGGFESGYSGNGIGYIPNVSGSTIPGWTVSHVDWIGSHWQAAAGSNSIDLNSSAPGSISQTIATAPGTNYVLSFALAGNPDGGPSTKTLQVLIDITPWNGLPVHSRCSSTWTATPWRAWAGRQLCMVLQPPIHQRRSSF